MNFFENDSLNDWLASFFSLVETGGKTTRKIAQRIYILLTIITIVVVAMTFTMWIINWAGALWLNIILLFVGVGLLVFHLYTPNLHFYAAIAGITISKAEGTSLSKDALDGIGKLHSFVASILFGFSTLAFFLSTWSFKNNPGSFWIAAAGTIVILATMQTYKFQSKQLFGKMVMAYAVITIIGALSGMGSWNGDEWNNPPPPAGSQTANAPSKPAVSVPSPNVYFTLNPGVPLRIPRNDRGNCNNDDLGKNSFVKADRNGARWVTFTSDAPTPIQGRIRFYDQMRGMTCSETRAYLRNIAGTLN